VYHSRTHRYSCCGCSYYSISCFFSFLLSHFEIVVAIYSAAHQAVVIQKRICNVFDTDPFLNNFFRFITFVFLIFQRKQKATKKVKTFSDHLKKIKQ